MTALIEAHEGYWFEKDTFRFFSSRISWGSLTPVGDSTWLFISSESNYDRTKRFYSLRTINASGDVDTKGDFQRYATLAEAKRGLAEHSYLVGSC